MSAAGGVLALLDDLSRSQLVGRAVEIGEARATVEAMAGALDYAVAEFADKAHVARCRGDAGLADYYQRCHDRIAPALSRYHGSAAPAGDGGVRAGREPQRHWALTDEPPADAAPAGGETSFARAFLAEYNEHEESEWSPQWRALAEHARAIVAAGSAPAPSAVPEGMAERITDYLCEQEYDIGGRDELLSHVRAAMAAPTPEQQR